MKNRSKAQAALEFALSIPIVLVMMMGIIEGGRLLFIYTSLSAAGREAARYGASIGELVSSSTPLYNDCAGIRAAAARIGFFTGVKADEAHVKIYRIPKDYTIPAPNPAKSYYPSPIDPALGFEYCKPNNGITIVQGDRIWVEVTAGYDPIVPLIPIPHMDLYSQSAHTLVKEAPVVAYTPQVVAVSQTCDNTPYKIVVTNPLGPAVTVTLKNTSSENRTIKNMLVVWDPTSGPILNDIYKDGTKVLAPLVAAPAYTKDVGWSFIQGVPVVIKLDFSKSLKNNVIVRFDLDNSCAFGQ